VARTKKSHEVLLFTSLGDFFSFGVEKIVRRFMNHYSVMTHTDETTLGQHLAQGDNKPEGKIIDDIPEKHFSGGGPSPDVGPVGT
jgi:hypothetical protein